MISGLKERFAIIRKETGQNTKDFADSLGMESTTVSSIESGKREPSKEVLCSLSSKFAVNLNWILTGNGAMFLDPALQPVQSAGHEIAKSGVGGYKVPLLRQKVSCGHGVDWQNEDNIVDHIDVFDLIPRLKIERLFAMCVQGSSMLGAGIRNGDYVLFDAARDQHPYDGNYVFALDGDVYCKRLEFDGISKRMKIYSVRVADLEKAELLTTLDEATAAERVTILGRVRYWVHPDLDDD